MALAAVRDTNQLQGYPIPASLELKLAAVKVWQGSLVMVDAGYLKPGAAATGKFAAGMACATVDNSAGAAGDKSVEVKPGVFRWANSASGDLIAQADVGKQCYIVDDQTVALTNGSSTRSVAGLIVGVDSIGVWVLTGLGFNA